MRACCCSSRVALARNPLSVLRAPSSLHAPLRQGKKAARPSKQCRAEREDAGGAASKPLDQEWVQEVVSEITDTSELGQRGEVWFAAQVLSLGLVFLGPPAFLRPLVDVAGWAAIAAGVALLFAGQQALGTNLTPFPKPRDSGTLVTEGAFEYVRHPMYGGLLLAALGFSLTTGDELRLLLAAASLWVLDQKSEEEERLLVEKFGEQYEQYKLTTAKLIPFIY